MIRKLVLDNFMAHAHTEVELGPGMTVLTGPNNIGKSALVEGLRCLATNPPPKTFIRHGADKARVEAHVEGEDGRVTRIAWVRRKSSAVYELFPPGVDGEAGEPEVFAKLGRGHVPDEVRDALRLDPVTLETGQDVDVHIGNQREPIFLLNMPPSAAAAFFAASTESAHLLAMQNLLKRRVLDARREEKRLGDRVQDIERGLDELDGLPALALAVDQAVEREQSLEAAQRDLPKLETLLADLIGLAASASRTRERTRSLAPLRPPGEPAPVRDLARTLEDMAGLERSARFLAGRGKPLGSLAEPPETTPTADLAGLLDDLARLEPEAGRLGERGKRLTDLQPSPSCQQTRQLFEITDELYTIERARVQADNKLKQLDEAGRALDREIQETLDRLRICPLCGSRLHADEFFEHGAGGGD